MESGTTNNSNNDENKAKAKSERKKSRPWYKKLFIIERPDSQSLSRFVQSLYTEIILLEATKDIQESTAEQAQVLAKAKLLVDQLEKKINVSFDRDDWHYAYSAEHLINGLYSPEKTLIELQRRTREATQKKLSLAEYYKSKLDFFENEFSKLKNASTDKIPDPLTNDLLIESSRTNLESQARQTLLSLLKDLHTHYLQIQLKTEHARDAMYRVVWVFIFAFALFVIILVTQAHEFKLTERALSNLEQNKTVENNQGVA